MRLSTRSRVQSRIWNADLWQECVDKHAFFFLLEFFSYQINCLGDFFFFLNITTIYLNRNMNRAGEVSRVCQNVYFDLVVVFFFFHFVRKSSARFCLWPSCSFGIIQAALLLRPSHINRSECNNYLKQAHSSYMFHLSPNVIFVHRSLINGPIIND